MTMPVTRSKTLPSKKWSITHVRRNHLLLKRTLLQVKSSETPVNIQRKHQTLRSVYRLGKVLGSGAFGVTYHCQHKETGDKFACKSICKQGKTPQDILDVRTEIQIMKCLAGKDSIVQLREVYEDEDSIHLIMERCYGGELFDRLFKKRYFREKEAASVCRQLVQAVRTCHSVGVMHRDLKMANILYSSKEKDSSIRLIDFGLSVFCKDGEIFRENAGSPDYMAPEIYLGMYSKEADLWSAGVILYALLCGENLFNICGEEHIEETVTQEDIPFGICRRWYKLSEGAKDLIQKMIERDPKKRFTADQVLSHAWIQENA